MTRIVTALAFCLLLASAACAAAQAVEIAATASSGGALGGSLAILGAREGDVTADVRFGVVPATLGAPDVVVEVRIARSATLGLLGAATLELEGAVRTNGNGAVRLSGGGVIGPAAVRVGVAVATAAPEALTLSGIAPFATAPRVAGGTVAVDADVRYRIDRRLLLALEPDVVFTTAGPAFRARGSLRARRLVEPFDGVVAFQQYLAPGDLGASGAVGVGAVWVRRRAPELSATVWLGWSDGNVYPGIELEGSTEVARGTTIAVAAAAEPYRLDVPPYRARVALQATLGRHEMFVAAEGVAGLDTAAAVTAGARFALPPR